MARLRTHRDTSARIKSLEVRYDGDVETSSNKFKWKKQPPESGHKNFRKAQKIRSQQQQLVLC